MICHRLAVLYRAIVGTSAEAIDQTVESHVIEVSTLHEVFMRCSRRTSAPEKTSPPIGIMLRRRNDHSDAGLSLGVVSSTG